MIMSKASCTDATSLDSPLSYVAAAGIAACDVDVEDHDRLPTDNIDHDHTTAPALRSQGFDVDVQTAALCLPPRTSSCPEAQAICPQVQHEA